MIIILLIEPKFAVLVTLIRAIVARPFELKLAVFNWSSAVTIVPRTKLFANKLSALAFPATVRLVNVPTLVIFGCALSSTVFEVNAHATLPKNSVA